MYKQMQDDSKDELQFEKLPAAIWTIIPLNED